MNSMYPMTMTAQAEAADRPSERDTGASGAAGEATAGATRGSRSTGRADAAAGRRIQVRKSTVHGKGVFAARPIAQGETIIEYKGEVITWKEALRRHPHDPDDPNHTFYFHIDEEHVIDAKFGGNAARWINHSCDPNCEADEVDGRIFIKALRALKPGEELFYDYGLVIDERYTPKLKKQFECRCGARTCRHTMLAPKRARAL
jgi:uncharacterized protein